MKIQEVLKYLGMVFCLSKFFCPTLRKKCFSDREKLLKFEAEGRELDGYKIRQSKINSRSVAGPMGQMNRRPSV